MTKMHLMWFCAFSPHAGFGLDGWAGPRTTGYEWTRPELWQDMAVALERAKFDLIMLGDSLAVPGTYQGRMDAYLRYAEHVPFHDPGPLVAIMAAATRRIGLAATLSTTFYPPFLLARLMTTLDHLSRGRIAWNAGCPRCAGGEERRKWTGGGGAENGDSVNWAFMRPLCGLHALTAVDGTAAGDAFCAALVVSLLQGRERREARARACAAGASAASRPGAQPSLPTAAKLEEILAR